MITPLAAPAALLLLSLSAAAAAAPASFDRRFKFDLDYSSLRAGPGATIQFSGLDAGEKLDLPPMAIFVHRRGRFSLDLADPGSAPRLLEDVFPTLPAVTHRYKSGSTSFELVDAAGAVRFKGSHHMSPGEHVFSPDNRRFVYVARGGRLTVVDLRTFKDQELGKGGEAWNVTDRLVVAKGKDLTRVVYDFKAGVLCQGHFTSAYCEIIAGFAEPAFDRWFRRDAARAGLRPKSVQDFDLFDRDGVVRFSGSSFKMYEARRYFSPDGRWFLFADRSGHTTLVDLETFTPRVLAKPGSSADPYHQFSAGGRFVGAQNAVYETETGRKTELSNGLVGFASPDDRWSVLYRPGSGYWLYSIEAGTTTVLLGENAGVPFSPGSRYVRSGKGIHEVPSGRLVVPAGDWHEPVFGPGDRYMAVLSGKASGQNYCAVEVLDLRYGVAIPFEFERNCAMNAYQLQFSGDGGWLATYTGTGNMSAWRLRRGMLQRAVIAALRAREADLLGTLTERRADKLAESALLYSQKAKAARPSKGEFESSAEYAARLKAADEQDVLLAREAEGEARRLGEVWERKMREELEPVREAKESAIDEEISETVPVVLGDYDADAQEFPASFVADEERRAARLSVPRKDAPAAKARAMRATVVYRHRLDDGRPARDDLRVSVRDSELGEVYSWSSGAGVARRARSAPTAPAKLELKAEFDDADGDGRLSAGETAKITAAVVNSGAGAAYGVSVSIEPGSLEGLSYAGRHFVGEIPSGAARSASISVKALAAVADGSRALTVAAVDANGFSAEPMRVVFETRARRGARLVLSEFKVREAGGDGVVTPGELVDVSLKVRNDGEGAAQAASVAFSGANDDLFVQGESRRGLGALAPGQTAEARFTVFSNTSLSGEKMSFSAALTEGADTTQAPVEIPLRRPLGATRELIVKGKALPASVAAAAAAERPKSRGAARADAYAVVLGAEDYPKAARVSHARRDAGAFRQFAVDVLGVPDDANHLFYLDEGVTLAELRKAFSPNGWLARRVGPESDVFVFYAGHGAPSLDGKGAYLVPQDGDPNYAMETGFLVDDMLKALNGSKARSATVWLDACFSGADRESRPLLADARPLMLKADVQVPDGKVSLFSAASGAQVSSAYPAKSHGLFTWFSLRGLDGEADADKNGSLTAGELADFVAKSVSKTAGSLDREQTPGFHGDRARVLVRYGP